jgi:hypothetical protein
MQSPSIEKPPQSHTPDKDFSSIVKVSQENRAIDGWRETGWFLKDEEDEITGYVFDSELLREGSD